MPLNFPTPFLPQTSPIIESPQVDLTPFMAAYAQGVKMKNDRRELELKQDELLQKADYYSQLSRQHEIDAEMEGVKQKIKLFELTNGLPTRDDNGVVTTNADARHAPMNISSERLGINMDLQPTSAQEQNLLAGDLKGREAAATAAADDLQIPDWLAESLGQPGMAGQKVDPRILQAAPQMVEQPPELGGGTVPEAQAKLNEQVFGEKEATKRTRIGVEGRASVAAMRYGTGQAQGIPDEAVEGIANQVATGQVQVSQVPITGGMRNRVLMKLATGGTAVPDKALIGKLSQFGDAQAAVEELKVRLDEMQKIDPGSDPWGYGQALRQFDVDRSAFARKVGRALGEVGVFTDQDKADFALLLGENLPITAVFPGMARDRLTNLDNFMNRVYNRNFAEYEKRVGAKLKMGPQAEGVATKNIPMVISEVRKVNTREEASALTPGTVFQYNGSKYKVQPSGNFVRVP